MAIYRGTGVTGTGGESDFAQLAQDAEAAAAAAQLAETNAETAEANAELAETNAETAATNASTSATNAANSASAASTSATNASSSATSASNSASTATTQATNAANSATAAATSASSASTSATNAASSASTATTQATNAANSATAAATSATNASNSASAAATSATNAANSATSASTSATSAAASASAAAATLANAVQKTGDETIAGTKTFSSNPILSGGTANGVAYLNGSKVLTTGSALTFDGSNLGVGVTSAPPSTVFGATSQVAGAMWVGTTEPVVISPNYSQIGFNTYYAGGGTNKNATANRAGWAIGRSGDNALVFNYAAAQAADNTTSAFSEQMRLTSTGLGIGTSSPAAKVHTYDTSNSKVQAQTTTGYAQFQASSTSGDFHFAIDNSTGAGFGSGAYARLIYSTGAYPLVFATNGAERARIDASGNLGLGITPSTWSSGANIELSSAGGNLVGRAGANLVNNAYYNSGWKYIGSSYANYFGVQNNGQFGWFIAYSGTAGNAISFTQAMTLDASGNLIIGTTSSALQSGGTGVTLYGSTASELKFLNSSTGSTATDGTALVQSSLNFIVNNREAGAVTFGTNNTERMRIDSSGNVGIGTSSPSGRLHLGGDSPYLYIQDTVNPASDVGMYFGAPSAATYAGILTNFALDQLLFRHNSATRMTIDSSGNLGLGVTPSAWNSAVKAFDLGAVGNINGGLYATQLTTNAYYSAGGSWVYKTTAGAAGFTVERGSFTWAIAPSGTAGNTISFTQAMTLDASGNLLVGKTSATANGGDVQVSKGITFPATQSASSDANTLDDYEEGTWTPVLTGESTAGSYTFVVSGASYTKIGNQVTVWCSLVDITQSSTGSGNILITGLPFTIANTAPFDRSPTGALHIRQLGTAVTGAKGTYVFGAKNSTKVYPLYFDGTNDANFTIAQISSGATDIGFSFSYQI